MAPVLALLALIAVVSGCGQAKKPSTQGPRPGAAAKARMEAHLRAHGYSISNIADVAHQPYEQTFSVDHIDWTTPRSFTVSVFIFDSNGNAQAHSKHTARLVGRFPWENRSKLVGSHLFVATEDAAGGQCTIVNRSLHCPPSPGVPIGDFVKLTAIAEGH
jgi:hypothetical protein